MRRLRWPVMVLGVLVACVSPGGAEVSVDDPAASAPRWVSLALQGGGDDACPSPWSLVRDGVPASWVLNPDGDQRGDGHPAAAFPAGTFRPAVAWATPVDGAGRDVVLAEWAGDGWSAPETVAGGPAEQRGPDVAALPGGGLVVTWWEDDGNVRQVWVRKRTAAGEWEPAEAVSPAGEDSRWPAVTVVDGEVLVGWFRERGDGTREVVVAREGAGWSTEVIGETGYAGPGGDGNAYLELHAVGSRAWADWRLAGDRIATSRRDPASGEWSGAEEIPCENSPDGRRQARWEAKRRALGW